MKKLFKIAFLIVATYCLPLALHAETYYLNDDDEVVILDGPATPGEGDVDDVVETPIDGGLSVLLAAGLAYGVKRNHSRKKRLKRKEKGDV